MHHFVYKTTNLINGKTYIGKHSTENLDDGYLGSGIALTRAITKYGREHFKREIMEYFNSSEEALLRESEIVDIDFINRDDNYNLRCGGYGGEFSEESRQLLRESSKGLVCVEDAKGNKFKVSTTDPRYLSGELVCIHKNTVLVKDNDGNIFRINVNDPRYISGELVPPRTGHKNSQKARQMVSDKLKGRTFSQATKNIWKKQRTGKSLSQSTKDKIGQSHKKHITVRDNDGNTLRTTIYDPKFISGEYVAISKGKIWISHLDSNKLKLIYPEDLQLWLDLGWIKGRKRKGGK